MVYKFKRGDRVRVKGEDFAYSALVIKRLPTIAEHEDEPRYLIREVSMKPPYEPHEEYEGYLSLLKSNKEST